MSKYREIAADLRDRRLGPEFALGDRLPALSELQRQYGDVALNTVRAALNLLAEEKLLRIEQGTGTFVAALPGDAALSGDGVMVVDLLTELRDANEDLGQALDHLDAALNDVRRTQGEALNSAARDLEAMNPPLDIAAVPAWLRERAAHRG